MQSPEIAREMGAVLLSKFHHLRVNVTNPDIVVMVEIREKYAYIHGKQLPGAGGMPIGTSGRGLLLLSGGNIGNVFSPAQALSFLLFFIFYSPCFAALGAIKEELGAKTAFKIFFFQTTLAYGISFVFYQFAALFQNLGSVL